MNYVVKYKRNKEWSNCMVRNWLESNMMSSDENPAILAENIVNTLSNHTETSTHSRHIHMDECKRLGIKIIELENMDDRALNGCKDLQDCVLTIHHSYMHTFSNSTAVKIVENHMGNAMIMNSPQLGN